MDTIAIFGVGLIGGSFAMALRAAGFQGRMLGVSSQRTIDEALRLGVIDAGATLEHAAATADLLFLSQPILQILDTIDSLAGHLRPGALVTDAGSTKARIAGRGRSALPPGAFLGGHPMAGKERRGLAVAEAGLFAGRTWVLTPYHHSELEQKAQLIDWIRRIGAKILIMSPEEHDRVVAITSHVPQLASTALALSVADQIRGDRLAAAGPGLIDMTRLAMSAYDIWADILATNGAVPEALDSFIAVLQRLRAKLTDGKMEAEFSQASALARRLRDFDSA